VTSALVSEGVVFIYLIQVQLAGVTLFELAATLFDYVFLKLVSLAWHKLLAVVKNTAFVDDGSAVLFEMSFALSDLKNVFAEVAVHFKIHKLIGNHSLHFDSLENLIVAAPIGTSHLSCHMLPTQHVVARFISTADWVL